MSDTYIALHETTLFLPERLGSTLAGLNDSSLLELLRNLPADFLSIRAAHHLMRHL